MLMLLKSSVAIEIFDSYPYHSSLKTTSTAFLLSPVIGLVIQQFMPNDSMPFMNAVIHMILLSFG